MIGEKDKNGNILRLGGKEVYVWELPQGTFLLQLLNRKDVLLASTEQEAVEWYNCIEDKNFFKLPELPALPNSTISGHASSGHSIQEIKRDAGILVPEGAKLLGKIESQSSPGKFYYVIQYKDGSIRCTCWPFIRTQTCNHYRLIRDILDEGATIDGPIIITQDK